MGQAYRGVVGGRGAGTPARQKFKKMASCEEGRTRTNFVISSFYLLTDDLAALSELLMDEEEEVEEEEEEIKKEEVKDNNESDQLAAMRGEYFLFKCHVTVT